MKGKALLFGLNYAHCKEGGLNGCINDVKNIKNMLISNYGFSNNEIIGVAFCTIVPYSPNLDIVRRKLMHVQSRLLLTHEYCSRSRISFLNPDHALH